MYTGLGKLSIQSEKWRSGVVMFLNVKFCYEIQHFWSNRISWKHNDNSIKIERINIPYLLGQIGLVGN
jgi:hypothetical protein